MPNIKSAIKRVRTTESNAKEMLLSKLLIKQL